MDADNGRSSCLQGWLHQLFVQCQMVIPKNVKLHSIDWDGCRYKDIYAYVYIHAYKHAITITKVEGVTNI